MVRILQQFQSMIQKMHNFEIARIHTESYVQYLQLLSQITLNCQVSENTEGFSSNVDFLVKNINEYLLLCVQEDQRKKLMNSKEDAQRNIIYQFFFVNYLISISQAEILTKSLEQSQDLSEMSKKAAKKQSMLRPISQKIFIILGKILETLSDRDLNAKLDSVILNRIAHLKPTTAAQSNDISSSAEAAAKQ